MSVEKQLRDCLLKYPGIFPNKWEVYHHWFIVNGNGYDWENGELVSIGDDETITTVEEGIARQDEKLQKDLSKGESDFILKHYKERHAKMVTLIKDVDKRMNDFTPSRNEIYPLCQYSDILHIPDDIQMDWKFAVVEMYNWLMNNYDTLGKDNQKYIKLIKL